MESKLTACTRRGWHRYWTKQRGSKQALIRERSLNAQAVALALGSGAAQVLVAVLYILTARDMPPAEYGLIATAIVLGLVGAGFLDFGSTPYWIRELASGRTTIELLKPRIATKFIIAFAVAALVVLVAALTESHFIATGVLLLSSTTATLALVPLRAARRAEVVGLLTALGRTVAVIAFFSQIAVGVELGLALWISIAVGDFSLFAYLSVSRYPKLSRFSFLPWSNPWAGAKWYSLNALSSNAQQLDLPLLSLFAGAGAAGVYAGVNRWTQPMTLATNSFASAAAPFLAAQSSLRAVRSQVFRASWMLVMVIALSSGVIIAAPWLVTFLLGPAYAGATAVLQWLGGAVILNAIGQPLLVALMSRLFDRLASVILTVSVIAQLCIVALLAPNLGPLSAAIGIFISQLLQFLGSAGFIATINLRRRRREEKRT